MTVDTTLRENIKIPPPQPPNVQTMGATPETLASLFNVTRDLQRAKHWAWVKLIGGALFTWIVTLGILWALNKLGFIDQAIITGGLIVFGLAVAIGVGFAWGWPDFLASSEMLSVLPEMKERLWQNAEIALNDLTGLGVDLNNDGLASTSVGDFQVSTYTDRLNGGGVRIDTHRLTLKHPFNQRFSHLQVMEFIKTSMASPHGFTRDKTWCVPGTANKVLLAGTQEELEVTRPVYDQIMTGLRALSIVGTENRQDGTRMLVSLAEARQQIMSLIDVKRDTTLEQ